MITAPETLQGSICREDVIAQVCGLVFEAGDSVEHLAMVVGEACQRLSAANIPHNLFVVDCGQRVFLFPNAFARAKAQGEVPEDLLDSQV